MPLEASQVSDRWIVGQRVNQLGELPFRSSREERCSRRIGEAVGGSVDQVSDTRNGLMRCAEDQGKHE